MNLLFPAMLAGAVGLAVPVLIHLINRARFPVRDFPALIFLRENRQTNVFAPRLIDRLQLLMRLIFMALLVLTMSRLFLPGLGGKPAARNLVIVMDCTASMKRRVMTKQGIGNSTLFDEAKRLAAEVLREENPRSRCAVVATNARAEVLAPLEMGTQPALSAVEGLVATDGTGSGLLEAVRTASDLVGGRREARTQILVFTDLRASSLLPRRKKDLAQLEKTCAALGDRLKVDFVDVAAEQPKANVAVRKAYLRKPDIKVGDDAHLVAHVVNHGPKEAKVKVNLKVGPRKSPHKKQLDLPPGGEAHVELTARINRSVRTVAQVRIDEDAYATDDAFNVPLKVADIRRVLIVTGEERDPSTDVELAAAIGDDGDEEAEAEQADLGGGRILKYVLNPGRELGLPQGTGIHTKLIAAAMMRAEVLSKYDIIILYDVSSLPSESIGDIRTYVSEGHALMIICSAACEAPSFNRTLAAATTKEAALAPARIGNEIKLEPARSVALNGRRHPLWEPFRDKTAGDLSVVRVGRIREVRELTNGSKSILYSDQGHPIMLESHIGSGRILQWMVGLERERTNLAVVRVFPPMVWRMVDYLTHRHEERPPDVYQAAQPAVLDASEKAFSFLSRLELAAHPFASGPAMAPVPPNGTNGTKVVPIDTARKVMLPALPTGAYELRKVTEKGSTRGSHTRLLTTFTAPSESRMDTIAQEELAKVFGADVGVLKADELKGTLFYGAEAWVWMVALMILAYCAEAVTSYVLTGRRDRERAREAE